MSWWRTQKSDAPGLGFRIEREGRVRNDVRMDVACFVGLAERGPLGRAVACDSWDDFELRFGRRGGFRLLAESVHQFFVNGGRRCVVVRVVGDTPTASWSPRGVTRWSGGPLTLHAHDPGSWGQSLDPRLTSRLRPVSVTRLTNTTLAGADAMLTRGSVLYFERQNAFRVIEASTDTGWQLTSAIFGTWASADGRVPRVYEVTLDFDASHGLRTEHLGGLGLDIRHPRWALAEIENESWLVHPDPAQTNVTPSATPSLRPALKGPWDSLLSTPSAHDGEATTTRETMLARVPLGVLRWADGPDAFEAMRIWDEGSELGGGGSRELEPVTQVVFPDLVHPGVYHPEVVSEDEEPAPETSLRFEVCSSDVEEPLDEIEAAIGSRYLGLEIGGDFDGIVARIARHCEADGRLALVDVPTNYASNEIMQLRKTVVSKRVAFYAPWIRVQNTAGSFWRVVPVTGAVAGAIAAKERECGPVCIPANVELKGILDLWEPGSLPDDGFLHALQINRSRLEWGTFRIMGSRVAVHDANAGHINVQRLLLYLRRQLLIDGRFAVFQPNNEHLWAQLRQMIERRLSQLHGAGALAGRSAAEAYRIKVDAELNGLGQTDAGVVRAHIGVAPSVPMEFIDVVFKLVANRGLEVFDG